MSANGLVNINKDRKTFADMREDGPVLSSFKGLHDNMGSNITPCLLERACVVFVCVAQDVRLTCG